MAGVGSLDCVHAQGSNRIRKITPGWLTGSSGFLWHLTFLVVGLTTDDFLRMKFAHASAHFPCYGEPHQGYNAPPAQMD